MEETPELREYGKSVADGTIALIKLSYIIRDELTAGLDFEEDCAVVIDEAKKSRREVFQHTFSMGYAPFMQPGEADDEPHEAAAVERAQAEQGAGEDVADEETGKDEGEETDEDETAAGSGDETVGRRGRR